MVTANGQFQNPACPRCHSTYTTRKGKRRNRLQTVPIFRCNECEHRFGGTPGKHKTYPLKYILEAISTYILGHSVSETLRILRQRAHIDVPERTVRAWLTTYRPFTTYARWRSAARSMCAPERVIQARNLEHRQVYRFQVHEAKLDLLLQLPPHERFASLKGYLSGVHGAFPHELFQLTDHRSSTFPARLHPTVTEKQNHATRLAQLVLPVAPGNKKRHEILQRFALINDSVTVAVEIPVYVTGEDIDYFRRRGFTLSFESRIITGHIDFLQVRNGYIHILDYKPEARKEKHAHVQLTIYALALSRRLNLPLKDFKCAWFDEHAYFEFFSLQGVYRTKRT